VQADKRVHFGGLQGYRSMLSDHQADGGLELLISHGRTEGFIEQDACATVAAGAGLIKVNQGRKIEGGGSGGGCHEKKQKKEV